MRKSKCKHLLFALLALLSIGFYACYDGEDWGGQSGAHRVSPRKRNKQLTTSVARQWYESHYDPVVSVSTRSGGDDEIPALIKPKWAHATERNRGRYEVVQMPILTQTRRMIVDEETRLHFDELRAQKKLRNSTHLVIMKDLKTGHVRSFISVFVGSSDYLKKTKRMSRNTYLYREKDFDGKVLFFQLNGSMINGWKYRDGKIVGKIMPIDEDAKILLTRSSGYWEEQCYTETYYEEVEECEEEAQPYYDEEFGLWGVETVVTCQKVDKPIYTQVCEDVWVEDEESGGWVDSDEAVSIKYYNEKGLPCSLTRNPQYCVPIELPEKFDRKYPKAAEAIRKGIAQYSIDDHLAEIISDKTGRNIESIKNDLIDGQGPILRVKHFTNEFSDVCGRYSTEDGLMINEKYVKLYEKDPKAYDDMLELLIVASVIHEFVHYNEAQQYSSPALLAMYYFKYGPETNSEGTEVELFGGVVEFSVDRKSIILRKK